MKNYFFKIILLCVAAISIQQPAFAQQKANLEEKVIGSTFKSLAKTFVVVTDINKLKSQNIKKLEKMSEAKFKKQQVKVYPVLEELPLAIKEKYGVREGMDKAQAIKNIESLNKKKIYEIIDNVPDATITRLFKQELDKLKEDIAKSDLAGQIRKFWDKIVQKSGGK